MRIPFLLVFLTLSLLSSATTYYIDPVGSNNNDGSYNSPWQTLSYACSRAVKSGDVIHVNAGTYVETNKCELAIGVSIEGVGDSSHIVSHFMTTGTTNGLISLMTLKEGTQGNQSISLIRLDGELIGTIAVYVLGRSNVKIYNCTVENFTDSGIGFRGAYPNYQPVIYATENEIYNCTIRNCSSRQGIASHGLIRLSGQSGMLIHDNILDQTERPIGENGNVIDAVEGYNKGVKYYKNKSYKPVTEGAEYNFHIESWNSYGGMEIYDNEFHGGGCHIDIAGKANTKGTYDFSWWIHDNLFMLDEQVPKLPNEPYVVGISFEATNEDAIVSNNHFKNLPYGIYHTINQSDRHQNNITIHSNLFEDMGYSNNEWAFAICLCASEQLSIPPVMSNFHIYNNTISSDATGRLIGGIHIQKIGSISNIDIKNNIISDCSYPVYILNGSGKISNVNCQNNIFFNNGNNNNVFHFEYLSNYIATGNLKVDPLFVAPTDFRLNPGSPAINSGVNVGLQYYGVAPDIGAFETPEGELHLNQLPLVNIASPVKGNSYIAPATLTIEIEASDPDGTISKVELFNGSVKLGESTAPPYSFTIKDLNEGSYSFHAVATDNLKSTAISSVLELKVNKYTDNRESFNLFPNPNDGRFSINFKTSVEADNYTITITNIAGNIVYRGFISKDEETMQFDLTDIMPGTYILMISGRDILLTQKFIKG